MGKDVTHRPSRADGRRTAPGEAHPRRRGRLVALRRVLSGRRPLLAGVSLLGLAFVGVGALGVYRYVDNYWLYRGFAAPKDPVFVTEHGKLINITVESPALGGRRQQVVVYLPPGYDRQPTRRYPVFYVLHGFPGNPSGVFQTIKLGVVEDTLVALKQAQPMIIVLPYGSTGIFEDKEWANGVHANQGWETFVTRDVVRAIDARYRTIPRPADRAISGLSEGGYAALNLAFHHPDEFSVIESWSGYMRADNIPAIFGGRQALLDYNSPSVELPKVAAKLRRNHVYIWFYSSTKDRFLGQNRRFDQQLRRFKIDHKFFVLPGGHTWVAWRQQAPDAYLAAAARLGGA
jgi:enterochelin esterase-like enzyme